jgi:hypothetical protein
VAPAAVGRVNISWQQVACQPSGPIEVEVLRSRQDLGGYIALALQSVAGNGRIAGVDLRPSRPAVGRRRKDDIILITIISLDRDPFQGMDLQLSRLAAGHKNEWNARVLCALHAVGSRQVQ